ncbi:MAG: flavodoxin family protein [Tissierellia bacterium]|nr:flavodoxin family protein [Tissierellia bacterium]
MGKIVYIEGSSRGGFNTEKMGLSFLNQVKTKNDSVKKYILRDLSFRECISCGSCDCTGICILRDDLTPLYKDLESCDLLIFASPVYFNSVSARSKMCIDRMQAFWAKRTLLKDKKEGPISVFLTNGGAPKTENQFKGSHLVMEYFFLSLGVKDYYYFEVSDTDTSPFQENSTWLKTISNVKKSRNERIEVKYETK